MGLSGEALPVPPEAAGNCESYPAVSQVGCMAAADPPLGVHGGETFAVIMASGDRQSGAWMRKAEEMLERLDIRPRGEKQQELAAAAERVADRKNGVEAQKAGYSVSMLMIDEAMPGGRFAPSRHAINCWRWGQRHPLPTMSTPCGKRREFFPWTLTHAGPQWLRVRVQATECPRIPKEFLEEQRSVMGLESFGQEHMCDSIAGAQDGSVRPGSGGSGAG